MSVQAVSWAMNQNPGNSTRKFVLVAIANHADESGVGYPGQERLAKVCCCSLRAVRDHMAALERDGFLRRVQRHRANGSRTSDWTVLAPSGSGRGRDSMTDGDPTVLPSHVAEQARQDLPVGRPQANGAAHHRQVAAGPEPSGETSGSLQRAGAGKKPVSYRGRKVPAVIVDEAVRLLGVFNEVCGRDIGARTQAGEASPALKQVIGAMMARPGVLPDQWEAAVRNTAANPPRWVDGPLQIGHVFGERAAEHALSNTGRVARRVRDPQKQERVDEFMGALQRLAGAAA